jgi:ribonuclease Y
MTSQYGGASMELNLISILLLIVGIFAGTVIAMVTKNAQLKKTGQTAEMIIENARKDANRQRKETILEAKEEIHNLKNDAEKEIKERKQEIFESEKRLNKRESNLERRDGALQNREASLDERDKNLSKQKESISKMQAEVQEKISEQNVLLERIGGLTTNEARDIIMERVEEDMNQEISAYIKEQEEIAKSEVDRRAKNLLVLAMQKYASDQTNEVTVSVVHLPNDDMKGRIIGREGRNIRTFEALTGVELIIDDTPEAVVLSGFDPVRREIAKRTLETLIKDGRIHPARIEEIVEKSRRDVDQYIREIGEEAVFEVGINKPHPDLVKLVGRLNFRTSYGQNVLQHSKEVAFLSGILAAEVGEDQQMAKRAGLLHDIGKAVDHEIEGSHVEIGKELAKRFKEPDQVINAITSHHGDEEAKYVSSVIVAAADALSAARPGARSDSLENYIKRLEQLEEIAKDFKGVEKSYAMQAGREVRIIVKPEEIDDVASHRLARDIKDRIENDLQYPGTIKVTVIRETRAVEEAK